MFRVLTLAVLVFLIACEDDALDRFYPPPGDDAGMSADASEDSAIPEPDANVEPDAEVAPDIFMPPDAGPVCPNGIIEGPEVCDGVELGGQTCVTQGFDDGVLECAAACDTFITDGCIRCGDGVREGSEICDGADLGDQTCVSLGYSGGALLCTEQCTLDESGCGALLDHLLIFYGDGGVVPNTAFQNAVTFDHWEAMLAPLGYSFTYTDQWPANLFEFRIIVTVMPGARTMGQGLSATEIADLDVWLDAGGTLFVLGDIYLNDTTTGNDYGAGCDGSNALLQALNIPIQLLNFAVATVDDNSPLDENLWPAQGVPSLPCAGLNFLALDDPAVQRIDLRTDMPVLASYQRNGAGRVLVISDTQCIDHMFNSTTDPVITTFVQNLTR